MKILLHPALEVVNRLLKFLIHNNAMRIYFKLLFTCVTAFSSYKKNVRFSHGMSMMHPGSIVNIIIHNNTVRIDFNLLFTYLLLEQKNIVRFSHENAIMHRVF